jgi:hypothetical protein
MFPFPLPSVPVPDIVTVGVPLVVLITPVPAVVRLPPLIARSALMLNVAPVETEPFPVTVSVFDSVRVPFDIDKLLFTVFVPLPEKVVVPAPALVRL